MSCAPCREACFFFYILSIKRNSADEQSGICSVFISVQTLQYPQALILTYLQQYNF